MPISPISSSQPSYGTSGPNAMQKLENYINEFKKLQGEWQNDPTPANLHKLQDFAQTLRDFLSKNESQITDAAKKMGWPPTDQGDLNGYQTMFKDAGEAIYNLLDPPPGVRMSGVINDVLEKLDQVHYLGTTPFHH